MADEWFPFWLDTLDSYVNELPVAQRWVALVVFSQGRRRSTTAVWRGKEVTLPPGQFVTTTRDLAKRANVSRKVVVAALAAMAKEQTITVEHSQRGSLITLLKYERRALGVVPSGDAERIPQGHERHLRGPERHLRGPLDPNPADPSGPRASPEGTGADPSGPRASPQGSGASPQGTAAYKDRARGDLRDLEKESGRTRAGAREATPPRVPPSPEERAATNLRRARDWHNESERRRSEVAHELGLDIRSLGLNPGEHFLRHSGLLDVAAEYSDEDIEGILAVREAQARAERSMARWDGRNQWHPKAVVWAHAKSPAEFGAPTETATPPARNRRLY